MPSSPTSPPVLPFRATLAETLAWLEQHSGERWDLARVLEWLTPYVWLDYDAALAFLFGDEDGGVANGGYPAPIFFEDDIARLAAGSEDVLITRTKDVYKIVAPLPAPGLRRPLQALLFQKRDVERLPARVLAASQAAKAAATPAPAQESRSGIDRQQVLEAFAPLLKIDLEKALREGLGVFGDDGARVKGSARKSPKQALYNPVTLALGLNDLYKVPLPRLGSEFRSVPCLVAWREQWELSLALLR